MTTIFFIGLGGLMLLFAHKAVELRRGEAVGAALRERADRMVHDGAHAARDFARKMEYRRIENTLRAAGRRLFHFFDLAHETLQYLYGRVRGTVERRVRAMHARRGAVSFFLRDVLTYKRELRERGANSRASFRP